MTWQLYIHLIQSGNTNPTAWQTLAGEEPGAAYEALGQAVLQLAVQPAGILALTELIWQMSQRLVEAKTYTGPTCPDCGRELMSWGDMVECPEC